MSKFVQLTQTQNAVSFRNWFHTQSHASDKDVIRAYIDVLAREPWFDRALAKVGWLLLTTFAGILSPTAGIGASVIDTFIVNRVLAGRPPKFFISDLKDFSGQIVRKKVSSPASG